MRKRKSSKPARCTASKFRDYHDIDIPIRCFVLRVVRLFASLYLPPNQLEIVLLDFAAPCSTFLSKLSTAELSLLPVSLLNSLNFFSADDP
jgi:hypothetical protein